jgi:hypothetical protein
MFFLLYLLNVVLTHQNYALYVVDEDLTILAAPDSRAYDGSFSNWPNQLEGLCSPSFSSLAKVGLGLLSKFYDSFSPPCFLVTRPSVSTCGFGWNKILHNAGLEVWDSVP